MPYRPPQCSPAVDAAIHRAKNKYNLPRWFIYAVVHRESTFDPKKFNPTDGGVGLTQLTHPPNYGKPYPYGLFAPDNRYQCWINDKGINRFGEWIKMADVSRMTDEYDPDQNLDRYHTVYAVPWYRYLKSEYRSESDDQRLRRLAFHWYRGLFEDYEPTEPYLKEYDDYVKTYRPPVESDDGVWDGNP